MSHISIPLTINLHKPGSDWEIGSDITEASLMLNDDFDVEIGDQSDYWGLELPNAFDNDRRNTNAAMETGTNLPALPPSSDGKLSKRKRNSSKIALFSS